MDEKNESKINVNRQLNKSKIVKNSVNLDLWSCSNLMKNVVTTSSKHKQFLNLNSKLLIYTLILYTMIVSTNACDVWKASECQGQPSTAEEELMKSDDYTKEQLYKYCDKGKAYVDCVNSKLKCCDLKLELRGSLQAYDKQLQKVAWKLGPYCAGLGESNVVKYKCRTTTKGTTTTATKSTKSTLPPCQIDKVKKFRKKIFY